MLSESIKKQAHAAGFELVGIAPVEPVPELEFYQKWIEAGYAGEMAYLERNADKKQDTRHVVPEARSVVVCAKIYNTDHLLSTEARNPKRGWISRYSWGNDYHDLLQKRLFDLVDYIQSQVNEDLIGRVYVDTGPVIDRVYAKYAGIGWFGKNTCIINQSKGSWFFIGEIITDLELTYDEPAPDRCGTCTRCIDACPTDAILEPYVLDSRRCISYLTIELKHGIPPDMRSGIGNHVFGCDICQDVCPWNRKAAITSDADFQPRPGLVSPELVELASLTTEKFLDYFRRSPIRRAKHRGLLRNVVVAMGNSGEIEFLPLLQQLSKDGDSMIAEHADWAIENIEQLNE